MDLISQTAMTGGPASPKFAPLHATPAGPELADPRAFVHGPPIGRFADVRGLAGRVGLLGADPLCRCDGGERQSGHLFLPARRHTDG
jgi:hypothetical protein